jgi:uncharacterized membrane protein YfcA
VLLGILILADVFAAGYYRRHANWPHLVKLLPPAFVGIVAGYFVMKVITDRQLRPIIGVIVLAMLIVNYLRATAHNQEAAPTTRWHFAPGLGFMAGVTTMMANAAGPVMTVYLLAMRLPKIEFVGTSAWFFFVVNWLKVPFSAKLRLMNAQSLLLDFMVLPCIAAGAFAGIFLLKKIPQKTFEAVVQILAAAAAIQLLL